MADNNKINVLEIKKKPQIIIFNNSITQQIDFWRFQWDASRSHEKR